MRVPGPDFLCGLDAAVDVVGGKWKALILWALSVEPRRTGELRRELDGVTEKVLIQQLRELERDGIVLRTVHDQVPPKVVYSLTRRGAALDRALMSLGEWGEENRAFVSAVRRGEPPRPSDDADDAPAGIAGTPDRGAP